MIFRVAIGFQVDSTLPRDVMQITPHFFGDDPQALADRLKTNLIAHTQVTTKPFKIKVYNAEQAPPSYPLATAEQTGAPPSFAYPREVSICLSYYSTYNRPRYRGRIYLPAFLVGGTTGQRPTTTQITNALNFRTVLTNGLPTGHNWVVYSKTNGTSYGVSHAWVDDEWDIQRRRGLRPTTRQEANVP